jgi:primosomal protein N' (replication factor Y)
VVLCSNCKAPVVLYGTTGNKTAIIDHAQKKDDKKRNLFVCHHCGERRDAQELCSHCGGWRLHPLGIGTEHVFTEIQRLYPDRHCIIMDKEHIKTHAQAVRARDAFYSTPGSVLVGTEMALGYLNDYIHNTAVVSMDSFFSIPDFRINEKIFHIILEMRALAKRKMLIQTRQDTSSPHRAIFEYAIRGNLIDFYKEAIDERKQCDYPPFTTYIKLTLEGDRDAVRKEMKQIAEYLLPHTLLCFDGFIPGNTKTHTTHGLISLPRGTWVNAELLSKLRSLPPYLSVKVDPDSLL